MNFISVLIKLISVLGAMGMRMKYILLDLFYDYNVLESYILVDIMKFYYSKYYQIYVNNFNVVEEKLVEVMEKSK